MDIQRPIESLGFVTRSSARDWRKENLHDREQRGRKKRRDLTWTRKRIAPFGSLEEAITGRIVHPGIIVGAAHASLEVNGLPGHLLGRQLAGMRHPTRWWTLHHALLPPGLEVLRFGDGARILDPLNHLGHRYEVDVGVALQDLVDPIKEGVQKLGIILQPGSVEVETEGRAILLVVTVEIVIEEIVELVTGQNVAAGVHHGAAGQVLVVLRVLATIQLVHHHFPDGVRSLKHHWKRSYHHTYIFL